MQGVLGDGAMGLLEFAIAGGKEPGRAGWGGSEEGKESRGAERVSDSATAGFGGRWGFAQQVALPPKPPVLVGLSHRTMYGSFALPGRGAARDVLSDGL